MHPSAVPIQGADPRREAVVAFIHPNLKLPIHGFAPRHDVLRQAGIVDRLGQNHATDAQCHERYLLPWRWLTLGRLVSKARSILSSTSRYAGLTASPARAASEGSPIIGQLASRSSRCSCEHRIGDRRIIRLIQKWLKAVLEAGSIECRDDRHPRSLCLWWELPIQPTPPIGL